MRKAREELGRKMKIPEKRKKGKGAFSKWSALGLIVFQVG